MSEIDSRSTPFLDAIAIYRLHCQAQRYRQSTLDYYRHRLHAFAEWLAAQDIDTLEAVTSHHIRSYIVYKQDRGATAHYLHGIARALRAFFNFCVAEELLDVSPMRNVKMPRRPNKILPALTDRETKRLLAAAKDGREKAFVMVMLDTGVRASEAAALRVSDVDIRSGSIRVIDGKFEKDRTVYVSARTARALLRYLRGMEPEQPLFPNAHTGKPMTRNGILQLVRRIARTAGIRCSPHKLRRTFAINSLRNGMNIFVLARLMGHSDINILRQYLDLIEGDLRDGTRGSGVVDNL